MHSRTHADPWRRGVGECAVTCGVWGGKKGEGNFLFPTEPFPSSFTAQPSTVTEEENQKLKWTTTTKKSSDVTSPTSLFRSVSALVAHNFPHDPSSQCLVRVGTLVPIPPHTYPPAPKTQIFLVSFPHFFSGGRARRDARFPYPSFLFYRGPFFAAIDGREKPKTYPSP